MGAFQWKSVINKKLKNKDSEIEEVAKMKNQLYTCLNKIFFYVKQPILIASTLLDPRFKSKYIENICMIVWTNKKMYTLGTVILIFP